MADKRLTNIETEYKTKEQAMTDKYAGLQQENDAWHTDINNQLDENERIQNELADKQLANTTQKIEQQKEDARQNKEVEEQKALNDYTAFTNPYGYQAEALASQGLLHSGVSETTKLGGFNTYQNRLASANKVMQEAITTYDMEINDAILNNDVIKAQNAYAKLEQKLTYGEKYFNNKMSLTMNQMNDMRDLSNDYFTRYQTMYQNIENEKAAAEAIRQFNEKMAEEKRQFNANLNEEKRQYNESLKYEKEKEKDDEPIDEGTYVDLNGNSIETQNKEDYLFKNNQNQPRYVNNTKLKDTGFKAHELGSQITSQLPGTNRIWTANGKYYVWVDKSVGEYLDVTKEMNAYFKSWNDHQGC